MRKPCCHIFAGGDSKTLMVVQVAPVRKNAGETFCSLDFASRVRNVELGQATKKVESVDSPYKSDVSEDIILLSIVFYSCQLQIEFHSGCFASSMKFVITGPYNNFRQHV